MGNINKEILEKLKDLVQHYEDVLNGDYSPMVLRSDIDKAKEIIKKANA